MSSSGLPILIIEKNETEFRGLSSGGLPELVNTGSTTVVQASTDIVKKNLRHVIDESMKLLDSVQDTDSNYEVDELELNLGIGAEGEVSILSAVTGSASITTSMKLVIRKKKKENE